MSSFHVIPHILRYKFNKIKNTTDIIFSWHFPFLHIPYPNVIWIIKSSYICAWIKRNLYFSIRTSPFDKSIIYKNIHKLVFNLWRLSTNLSNTPRACMYQVGIVLTILLIGALDRSAQHIWCQTVFKGNVEV